MQILSYVLLKHSLDELFDYMECYELANVFNPLVKQAQETNNSNEDKNKMKRKGQKHHKKLSDDNNALAPKCFCILHKKDDHWTNDCMVIKDQVTRMCSAWSAQSPAEHSCKKCENKQCQAQDKNDFHTMIKKDVQKCVMEAFQTHFATYCHDNKLDSDDDEQHQIESPHQPQPKCAKTHPLCPITTAFIET
jgi:hypothetical protein